MRMFVLFVLFGCTSVVPLKFKYNSSKRYLASLTRDDVIVARIEGELKNPLLFASGMDSTFLFVKLYDEDGNELTDVDPDDLTLSTSEDVEAKPFVRKQGVYKAEILPRVKSKSIRMRVDWKEKVLSEEILLQTTIAPLRDQLTPLYYEYFQSKSLEEISIGRGSAFPENATENFDLENLGDNYIVNSTKNPGSHRLFAFEYLEQARQNLAMDVEDAPNNTTSETMHSVFMFFPRKNLFLVEQLTGTINVTLPTGEKIIFQKASKEIVDGVFTEGPVDTSSIILKKSYPDLKYNGKGIVLRVNARGQSPQLVNYGISKIDQDYGIRGTNDALIINGSTGQRCRRPKADFWEPLNVSPIEFKFPTDEEFDAYLKKNCGFGLPKF